MQVQRASYCTFSDGSECQVKYLSDCDSVALLDIMGETLLVIPTDEVSDFIEALRSVSED